MPKYKIKKSYLELKDTENVCSIGSHTKNGLLKAGHEVTLENVPDKILKHLTEDKTKKGDK